MIKVTIKDTGVVNGLQNMVRGMKIEPERILDDMAGNAQVKMSSEAPEGETRQLATNVQIMVSTLKRIIEPVAKNLSGKNYAAYVETGTNPGYYPNIDNLMRYYALTRGGAWMMAKKIYQAGTKANPFVRRTYEWLVARKSAFAGDLAKNITIYYGSTR